MTIILYQDAAGDTFSTGSPAQQGTTVHEADTGTTEVQEQQESIIVSAEIRSEGTATADVLMEVQLGTPDAPMEVRDEQADIADAPIAASNPTEPITPGPTIASSSEQVTLHEPILNQPITPLMHLVPKTNSNISTGLQYFRFALL